MVQILADRDIRRLLGKAIVDADENLLNPNGIELRLGKHVLFHSTREERQLEDGKFLRVQPGESVIITSLESIDFSATTIQQVFPERMLMAFITPTTTMMREGISHTATKIDAGFRGILNWLLRNGSMKDIIIRYGEPIFKLTLFLLDRDESPDTAYGEHEDDSYQNSKGIRRSVRTIPADLPEASIVSSSFGELDPKMQLREAGYPFSHISTELTELQGKFVVVSTSVEAVKDDFEKRAAELGRKIEAESKTLSQKIEETKTSIIVRLESVIDKKTIAIGAVIVGAIPIVYGTATFLQETGLQARGIGTILTITGLAIVVIGLLIARRIG